MCDEELDTIQRLRGDIGELRNREIRLMRTIEKKDEEIVDLYARFFRIKKLLKDADRTIDILVDHHCGGLCPDEHEETMTAVNIIQGEIREMVYES